MVGTLCENNDWFAKVRAPLLAGFALHWIPPLQPRSRAMSCVVMLAAVSLPSRNHPDHHASQVVLNFSVHLSLAFASTCTSFLHPCPHSLTRLLAYPLCVVVLAGSRPARVPHLRPVCDPRHGRALAFNGLPIQRQAARAGAAAALRRRHDRSDPGAREHRLPL